ncbi:MAG: YbaB/EbfC family nucleoid-associated protein [Actinomycetota bacterium]|uniref:YbaB/EbfC family nucleoid-associated protein n=1 Tax=Mycobacterium lentiflavum TaxID=141349 RepID=A0ABY3UX66_MYCLN|nr:YbaB/EbfC family nucleoid-associated protein [Mycobacterium lentiflavum]MEE3067353.1 YbaB/EbfC family nucleoid-associated protein [Actinomycetota bacterium]ULP44171.1 YbaB/EbfC family nucleoid-associated protein [Mycobacterium lentiflavum]
MTAQMHPQVAEALRQAQQFQSIIDDHIHRTNTDAYTVTDETETVEVTVDGHLVLTDLTIEPGLLRLGAEAVEQRINDALRRAEAAATAAGDADDERLVASLAEVTGSLNSLLGLA